MNKLWFTTSICALTIAFLHNDADALPVSTGFFPAAVVDGEIALPIAQYLHIDFVEKANGPLMGTRPRADRDIVFLAGAYLFNHNYGIVPSVPWIHTEFKVSPPGQETITTKTSGWGDAGLTGIIRLWETAGKGWFSSVILLPAVIFPTGDWNQKNSAGPIDRTLQPGTGNWSGQLSVAGWYTDTTKQVTLNLQYQHYFRGHDFRFGDQWNYNASFGYLLLPWKLESQTNYPVLMNLNIEFLGTYFAKPHGHTVANYSQNWGRIAPAINIEFQPIYSQLNFAFHQTVYYHTEGGRAPIRPERVYQVTWETAF